MKQLHEILGDDEEVEVEVEETLKRPLEWTSDFQSLSGVLSEFNEESGQKTERTTPIELFSQLWDRPLVEHIVEESIALRIAQEHIAQMSGTGFSAYSRVNSWAETSVSEIYRLRSLPLQFLMGTCVKEIHLFYLVRGHSLLPADPVFGRLEKEVRKMPVITTKDGYHDNF